MFSNKTSTNTCCKNRLTFNFVYALHMYIKPAQVQMYTIPMYNNMPVADLGRYHNLPANSHGYYEQKGVATK